MVVRKLGHPSLRDGGFISRLSFVYSNDKCHAQSYLTYQRNKIAVNGYVIEYCVREELNGNVKDIAG